MSTRSMIAVQDADGACYAVYCHFDGYVSHMGKMLTTYFNDDESAADLHMQKALRIALDQVAAGHRTADRLSDAG